MVRGTQADDSSTAGRELSEASVSGGTLLKGASFHTPPDATLLSGDPISGGILDTAGVFRLVTTGIMTPGADARESAGTRTTPETSTLTWNWVEGLRPANR